MAVFCFYELERHSGRTLGGVKVAASCAKTGLTAKRNKVKFVAIFTAVDDVTVGIIAAVQHLFDIFKNGVTDSDAGIYDSIKMVGKNLLDNCHTTNFITNLKK